MLLNTFDFIEKPVRLICYEKHCYLYWKKKWESIHGQYHIRQFSLGRIYH
jgi:hypothetical protein